MAVRTISLGPGQTDGFLFLDVRMSFGYCSQPHVSLARDTLGGYIGSLRTLYDCIITKNQKKRSSIKPCIDISMILNLSSGHISKDSKA